MSDDAQRVDTGMQDVNEQMLIRRQKLDKLRAAGIDPYAVERFDRSHEAAQIHENFLSWKTRVAVAGGSCLSAPMESQLLPIFRTCRDGSSSMSALIR